MFSVTLFKLHLDECLEEWQKKCQPMGTPIGDQNLYTLLFADQVITTGDQENIMYIIIY